MSATKGRGAVSNQTSARFNLTQSEADGDWLDAMDNIDGPAPKRKTTVTLLKSKTIITYNQSPDIPFTRSINGFLGCEHGCIYCHARPSHAWHDLSPGLDFETKLFAKPNAAELLRTEIAKPSYRPAPIAMGTNTDPYQPIEARYGITRSILEVCLETRHPVTITTKSDRVLRDIDLLGELARLNLVMVGISVTSLDARLSGILEPRAASPSKRLAALERLAEAGVPTHVGIAPIIPAITDEWIERILEAAASRGVRTASWIMLRLPHEVSPLFREWLGVHFPDRAGKVMAIVQGMRGGRDNDPRFGSRMKPNGVMADLTRARFHKTVKRLGLNVNPPTLNIDQFVPPARDGQLKLL